MSRYSGRMTDRNSQKVNGNKGVAHETRALKREEAEARAERYIADLCPCRNCTIRRQPAA